MGAPPPLQGVTVLDLASVGPAARASRALADYGATVVKVGPPPNSSSGPGGSGRQLQITPPFYAYSGHRGMQRMSLDVKADAGREAFLRLAESADVVIESFRPGVVDRLGIGYAAVRARNPGIVYCSTSGFGQDGPYASYAGHDVNYLAVGGFLDCSGRRGDGAPALPGATVADIAAGGMQAVTAIMAALLGRERSGEGAYLDISIADGVLSLMSLYADEYLATGTEPGPGHYILTGRYACYDVYATRDGRWLSVGAIEPKFWANLCSRLGLERWIEHQTDDAVQDEIRADLSAEFATRDRNDWAAELSPADTCVAPVLTVAEALSDPQFVHRGALCEAHHPSAGTFQQTAPLLAGMPKPDMPYELRDAAETDTDELLAAAGYTVDEIETLKNEGVVA